MPHFAEMVYQLGGLPVMAGIPFHPLAKYYFVDATNGSDGNDGLSLDKSLATLIAAEAKMVANHHDTLFIVGTSLNRLTAQLLWDKNYTHLIGICAPTGIAQRARIFQLSTLDTSPLMDIQATGCIFKDFYIFQGVDKAASLINVAVSGGRNYFQNVHFAGGGHATMAINGCASLKLTGDENRFVHCTIGVDTISAATGVAGLLFSGAGSEASRNEFDDCTFQLFAGNKNVFHIEVDNVTAIQRYNIFKRCRFLNYNVGNYSMDTVIEVASATGFLMLEDCFSHGADDWDDHDSGVVVSNSDVLTAGGVAGQFQATVVS